MYGYNGWRFVKTEVQPQGDIFTGANGVYQFTYHSAQIQIMFVDNRNLSLNESNVFLLDFKKTFPQHEVLESTLEAAQKMNHSLHKEILPVSEFVNKTYNTIKDDIVYLDHMRELNGKN